LNDNEEKYFRSLKKEEQEEVVKKVKELVPFSDAMAQKIMEDRIAAQEALRITTEQDCLELTETFTQKSIRILPPNRSVVLDSLSRDTKGKYYDMEVQQWDNDDHLRRCTLIESNLNVMLSEQGMKFRDLPDFCVVFLTKENFMYRHGLVGVKHCVYRTRSIVDGLGATIWMGREEIFVNAEEDDNPAVAAFMFFMKYGRGDSTLFPHFAARYRYFTEEQEGIEEMCEVIENYARKKEMKRTVTVLWEYGHSINEIVECLMKDFLIPYDEAIDFAKKYIG